MALEIVGFTGGVNFTPLKKEFFGAPASSLETQRVHLEAPRISIRCCRWSALNCEVIIGCEVLKIQDVMKWNLSWITRVHRFLDIPTEIDMKKTMEVCGEFSGMLQPTVNRSPSETISEPAGCEQLFALRRSYLPLVPVPWAKNVWCLTDANRGSTKQVVQKRDFFVSNWGNKRLQVKEWC